MSNVPIEKWDENGLGDEPNNLAAINSLIGYRSLSLRQAPRPHHHRPAQLSQRRSVQRPARSPSSAVDEFNGMFPGRRRCRCSTAAARSTAAIRRPKSALATAHVPNPQKDAPPQTILGADAEGVVQGPAASESTATWKIWGNSQGALDWRADPQNLPAGLTKETWPAGTYASLSGGDYGSGLCRARRDLRPGPRCEDHRLRHRLGRPPQLLGRLCDCAIAARQVRAGRLELRRRLAFEPRNHGSPGARLQKAPSAASRCSSPTGPARAKPDWTLNMLLKHGVRSCLEYAKSFDLERARALFRTRSLRRISSSSIWAVMAMRRFGSPATKCGPSSSASRGRSRAATGRTAAPCAIASSHTAKLWQPGERPKLLQQVLEGDPGLSI